MVKSIGILALTFAVPCAAQTTKIADTLIAKLQAREWSERAAVFYAIGRTSDAWATAVAAGLLRDALVRENELVVSTLRESKGASGVSAKYGEGYAEYYKELLESCERYCDKRDPLAIRALALSAYSSTSSLGRYLAEHHGAEILPVILERASSDLFGFRQHSVSMLTETALRYRGLLPAQRRLIHKTVVTGTADDHQAVRQVAVRGLGALGYRDDLALLQRIALRDADPAVRHEAAQAATMLSRPK